MRRGFNFAKRNILEMTRDPIIYIFCLGFPILMILLFSVINTYANGSTSAFELKSLIPGILMFSTSFVMLVLSLLVSKDKTSAFLVRLYTSPMKRTDFIVGYSLPCFLIGIAQEIICVFAGFIFSLISKEEYFSFGASVLLIIEIIPMLLISIFLGIAFGSLLNDKSAPGLTSIFITGSGILGGAWMPLDIMGNFENFCRFLPFYPVTYIGRIITKANHTVVDMENPVPVQYELDSIAKLGIIPIAVFLVGSAVLAVVSFGSKMNSDNK